MQVQSLQSRLTLFDPMDCSPLGSLLPFPSPGNLPDPGTEPVSLASPDWQVDSSDASGTRKPKSPCVNSNPHPTPFPVSSKKLILSTSCFTEKRFWLANSRYDVRDRHQHDKFPFHKKSWLFNLMSVWGFRCKKNRRNHTGWVLATGIK